jgi:hypothetical protein
MGVFGRGESGGVGFYLGVDKVHGVKIIRIIVKCGNWGLMFHGTPAGRNPLGLNVVRNVGVRAHGVPVE